MKDSQDEDTKRTMRTINEDTFSSVCDGMMMMTVNQRGCCHLLTTRSFLTFLTSASVPDILIVNSQHPGRQAGSSTEFPRLFRMYDTACIRECVL